MPEIKWIKITTDMFDDEKIKLIEKMPEADSLLVIWVKLICFAGKVNDRGAIYLTPTIPLDAENLATILNRPLNVIRLALETFRRFGMVEISDDGGLFLINFEKHQNIEGLERVRELGRARIGRFREKQRLLQSCNVTVTFSNATDKIRIDKSIEEEGEKTLLKKLVDEKRYDEVWIGNETLAAIIRCLRGEQACLPANLKLYQEQLKKLEIDVSEELN